MRCERSGAGVSQWRPRRHTDSLTVAVQKDGKTAYRTATVREPVLFHTADAPAKALVASFRRQ
jgi:hypothetical protein